MTSFKHLFGFGVFPFEANAGEARKDGEDRGKEAEEGKGQETQDGNAQG